MSVKNYLTEFVGTFFLVLTIGLAAASGTPMAPLVIGSVRGAPWLAVRTAYNTPVT